MSPPIATYRRDEQPSICHPPFELPRELTTYSHGHGDFWLFPEREAASELRFSGVQSVAPTEDFYEGILTCYLSDLGLGPTRGAYLFAQ